MDPYRVFFPLGALAAILGTLLWIPFGFGIPTEYPGTYHPDLMIGGFLCAFASGFLMTAIPQFTASLRCRSWELTIGAAGFITLFACGFSQNRLAFHALSAALLAALVAFCGKRFLERTYEPPPFFVFVGLGLAMGIAGATTLALCDLQIAGGPWRSLGKSVYEQGMMLSLTLGVGTHLLPAIWGFSDLPVRVTRAGQWERPWQTLLPVAALALALLSSFALEALGSPWAGSLLRAALVIYLGLGKWNLARKPKARGRLVFWLWISAWALLVGMCLPALFPGYAVHGLHVAFIGGFGLMTFLIAARVTLAHGNYGYRVELRSRLLTGSAILILLAALTRAVAPLTPEAYLHHLGYAAGAWVLAVLLWSLVFVPKAIRLRPSEK